MEFGSLELSSSTFDFDDATVRTTVGSPFFTKTVLQTYLSQCGEYTDSVFIGVSDVRVAGDRTSTLVYAHSHRQIKSLVMAFRSAGVRAAPMTGRMTRLVRDSTLQQFLNGDISVLIGCLGLIESGNMPNASSFESCSKA
jgi:hypothetical protein